MENEREGLRLQMKQPKIKIYVNITSKYLDIVDFLNYFINFGMTVLIQSQYSAIRKLTEIIGM